MTKLPDPRCVVRVGDGRGFIINHRAKGRLVITAAHCLPKLPPAHAASFAYERAFELLGTLDGSKTSVWAECLFVNPVADVAVLGCPDNQELFDQAAVYDELTEGAPFLRIDKTRSGQGWVLSLDGHWAGTTIETDDGTSLSIGPDGPNEPGMSGSPILNEAGRAVGVVVVGSERVSESGQCTQQRSGQQPALSRELPDWLLQRNH
jgi:Trypsin-like peptidase domain